MNYKGYIVTVIFLSIVTRYSVFSQTRQSVNLSGTPTASNFTYPQSIFIDSPNGHIWVTDFDNNRVMRFDVSSLTAVENSNESTTPNKFFLSQNFPNPFNPVTQISFSVNTSQRVSLTVFNLLGQKVETLFDQFALSGTVYSISFRAKNLPSGIYMYSLHTKQGVQTKRMCLIK